MNAVNILFLNQGRTESKVCQPFCKINENGGNPHHSEVLRKEQSCQNNAAAKAQHLNAKIRNHIPGNSGFCFFFKTQEQVPRDGVYLTARSPDGQQCWAP